MEAKTLSKSLRVAHNFFRKTLATRRRFFCSKFGQRKLLTNVIKAHYLAVLRLIFTLCRTENGFSK